MKVLDIQNGVATNDTRYHGLVFEGPPLWYLIVGGYCNIPDAMEAVERMPSDYRIVLSDGSEAVLAEYPFTPQIQEQRPGCAASVTGALPDTLDVQDVPTSILEFVPWHPNTAQVTIWHGERELAERQASANPPQVEVVTPNGGETVAGESFTVEWLAADLDGDHLSYTVLYSHDGGATWMTLVTGSEEKHYEVDTSLLAGSEIALVSIVVSNGIHIVADQSDTVFTVASKHPQVSITWPGENAWFSPDDVIILTVDAYDAEDGYPEDTALTWESDRTGPLGSGRSLLLTGQGLALGEHQITLTGTDRDGQVGATHVKAFVGHRVYLPLMNR